MNGWVLGALVLVSAAIALIGYSCLVVGSWADEAEAVARYRRACRDFGRRSAEARRAGASVMEMGQLAYELHRERGRALRMGASEAGLDGVEAEVAAGLQSAGQGTVDTANEHNAMLTRRL